MKHWIAVAAALAACGAPGEARRQHVRPAPNPSALVATELAFSRTAQEKGQWTAFDKYADKDAIMFVPEQVKAKAWLKGRANPAAAVKWEPSQVWVSCDGSLAVTKGPWEGPTGIGYFTTVWKRQKNGTYKWVLDQGDSLKEALPKREMIAGNVADCSRPSAPAVAPAPGRTAGWSDDKTLGWVVDVKPDNSRIFKVSRWTGNGYDEVIHSEVSAE